MVLEEKHDSDESENEERHLKLVTAVSELDNTRRVRAPTRKELSSVISEYHLPKQTSQAGDIVSVKELANVLSDKLSYNKIRNKLKNVVKKSKTLPKPLEKPVAERIKRGVGYFNVKGQLRKWNAVVERNRAAEHLSFPLQQGSFTMDDSKQFLKQFKTKTPLEAEINKILGEKEEETEDESELNKKLEFPLTLEEMLEKKKELAHIRAKLSYQEAKAYRQSKIKSKKYHRILKREKVKQQLKEFEQLVKSDPEAALKKLESLDRSRAQERASLRHKNTGKWAKNLAVRAKYDKDSRKVLAEQLKLSRDLTEKVKNSLNSDEDVSDQEKVSEAVNERMFLISKDNPWALNVSSEVSDFVSNCKKYWKNQKENSESNSKKNGSLGGDQTHVHTSVDKLVKDNTNDIDDVGINYVNENSEKNQTVDATGSAGDHNNKKLKKEGNAANSVNYTKKQNEVTASELAENCKSNINTLSSENIVASTENRMKNKKKPMRKSGKKKKSANGIQATLGTWTVTELDENRKRKALVDIDDIFDDLDEKLANKTTRKLKMVEKKLLNKKRKKEKVEKDSDTDDDEDLKMKPEILRPDLDVELGETTGEKPENVSFSLDNHLQSEITVNESPPEIDPNVFIDVKPKKLNTKLPNSITDECYMDDEEKSEKMNIVEAFVDDDIMEEFQEMKKEEEETSKLKVTDALPGWGCWGGTDIKPSERKNKRNMLNVPKPPPKKGRTKRDIIVRGTGNRKIIEHMVKDIPHPFQSVGAFEASIREPIGREWIPETAHRKFIKPPVETQMGVIIDPMDENELLRLAKDRKSLYRGKKKA